MFTPEVLIPLILLGAVGTYYMVFARQVRDWQVRVLNSHWYVLGIRILGIWILLLAAAEAYLLASHHVINVPFPKLKP